MGGNTKTVMVANVSPADDNLDEMLSNLLDQIKELEAKLSQQQQPVQPTQGASVDEEQIKKLIEQNEKEKQQLLENMKNQSEEEKNRILQHQLKLQEERNNLENVLNSRHEL